jgi:hypothetical protein
VRKSFCSRTWMASARMSPLITGTVSMKGQHD